MESIFPEELEFIDPQYIFPKIEVFFFKNCNNQKKT